MNKDSDPQLIVPTHPESVGILIVASGGEQVAGFFGRVALERVNRVDRVLLDTHRISVRLVVGRPTVDGDSGLGHVFVSMRAKSCTVHTAEARRQTRGGGRVGTMSWGSDSGLTIPTPGRWNGESGV